MRRALDIRAFKYRQNPENYGFLNLIEICTRKSGVKTLTHLNQIVSLKSVVVNSLEVVLLHHISRVLIQIGT